MLYAAVTSLTILLVVWILRRSVVWRALPLLFTTLVFVFMTQHPFPAMGQMQCPVASATPQLHVFQFWKVFSQLMESNATFSEWAFNRTVAATVMNFVVCFVIGIVLAWYVNRFYAAVAFGSIMTLTVELTQLTGLWGIYPCAYRQFNVDDLILNLLGVVCGFLLSRAFFRTSA